MGNNTEKANSLDEKNTMEDIDDDNEDTIVNEDDNMHKYQEDYNKNNDPVKKLFQVVFVNAKNTCNSQIEIPYFSIGIYSNICYRCGEKEDLIQEDSYFLYCKICEVEVTNNKKEQKRIRGNEFFSEKMNAKKRI